MARRHLTVFVYLPGEVRAVPAGLFTHESPPGVGSFAYGRRYLERPNAVAVDPVALPLGTNSRDVLSNRGIYGAFRDAAPDYWGRLVIAAEAKVPPEVLSELDYLVAANATRVGNLDFRSLPDAPEPPLDLPHFAELGAVLEAAEKLDAGEAVETHLLHLLRQGSSLGGARPKCTVSWNDALWLAKFSARGDTLQIPHIEYATMTLAARCGVHIPEVRLERVGGHDVYLCRRFDRGRAPQGWLRTGFCSSLSLMQWDEGDRDLWSYGAIAQAMRRYAPAQDLEQLFRRMIFNIVVRNTDDHPRNHGFLVTNEGLTLSPAYDLVPGLARPGVATEFSLAMSVGAEGRVATIGNALSQAARFGLREDRAQQVVEEVCGAARGWWDHFRECAVPARDIEALGASIGAPAAAGR